MDLSGKMSCCPAPADGRLHRLCLISLDFRRLITAYESWRASLRALTGVGEMNQRSEGLRIHSLHLDLLLLGLSDVAGEHSCKVVRHGAQDQPAVKIHGISRNVRDLWKKDTRGMFQVFGESIDQHKEMESRECSVWKDSILTLQAFGSILSVFKGEINRIWGALCF